MTVEQFDKAPVKIRTIHLWNNGVYIDEKIEKNYVIKLYSLHDYFVEVHIHLNTNKCEKIQTITEVDSWVTDIDIKNALNG